MLHKLKEEALRRAGQMMGSRAALNILSNATFQSALKRAVNLQADVRETFEGQLEGVARSFNLVPRGDVEALRRTIGDLEGQVGRLQRELDHARAEATEATRERDEAREALKAAQAAQAAQSKPAPPRRRATTRSKKTTAAASKTTAARKTAAKKTTTAAKKTTTAAKKTTTAAKKTTTAAKKPAAARKTAPKKPAAARKTAPKTPTAD